jgi:iron complex transport system ATP-binding protein
VISFEGVTVRYESTLALADLSDEVGAGEWVGLIGPNGAGKTTLLRAVARLVPHDGAIKVDGVTVSSMVPKALARLVAYVPQQPELPPDMTVGQYVLLGRTPHIGYFGFETRRDRTVCAGLLRSLDLAVMADRRLSTLSGGELQRLVLARALAQEAPVLLLDEPTSALDLGRRVDALELVDGLRRERGLTVLSALHDLTLAGQFADRLIMLGEGRAVSTGKPDEVLTEEGLALHFGASVRVMRSEDGDLVVVPRRVR